MLDIYDTPEEFFQKDSLIFKDNFYIYKLSELFLAYKAKENEEDFILALKRVDHSRGGKTLPESVKPKRPNLNELKLVSLVFPFLGTTTATINRKESDIEPNFRFPFKIDTLIVDEAGMVPSGDLIHSLNISDKAIIVGDPKQLPPISNIPEILENELLVLTGVNKSFFEKYSPNKISCYHRAAGAQNGDLNIVGLGILLDEHRRCQKPIAELFKIVADYPTGLKIETKKITKDYLSKIESMNNPLKNLEFYNVKLAKESLVKNTNNDEIDTISKLIIKIEKAGYNLTTDVGIITPYRSQSKKLLDKFCYKLAHTEQNKKIGTVHSFQGAEFKVIIFSSVVSRDSSTSFVSDNIPLLNVSISRAKDLFIHVGDKNKLRNSSSIMKKYFDYFEKEGVFYESKDLDNY